MGDINKYNVRETWYRRGGEDVGFIWYQEERVLRRGMARSAKHLYVLPVPPKEPETPYPDTLTPIGPPGYLIPPPRVKRLDGFPFADT